MPTLSSRHWLFLSVVFVGGLGLGFFIGLMSPRYLTSTKAQELATCTDQDHQYNQTLSNPLFYSQQQSQSIGQILKVSGSKLTIRRLFFVRDVEASDQIVIVKNDSDSVTAFTTLDKIELDKYAKIRIEMVDCRLKVVSINYII